MPQLTFSNLYGSFHLERLPHDPTHTLKAWDAADELMLAHYHKYYPEARHPLILNDNFGALGVSLYKQQPTLVTDSCVSQRAFFANRERNQLTRLYPARQLDSLSPLPCAEVVLIKLPKTARYFDYQLRMLNAFLPDNTPVVIGAMNKYLSNTFYQLCQQLLEGTTTSRAHKKARLVCGYTDTCNNNPLENVSAEVLELPDYDLTLFNAPHVFSSGKLDIGSRFFLNNFPNLDGCKKLIDLGCGNGVLGLMAMKQNPQLDVTFVDESYHAICAAKASVSFLLGNKTRTQPALTDGERVHFQVNHCLDGYAKNSVDTILCNPPFHQQQSVGTRIARQMFRDSAQVLRAGGSLYVIGNRHLTYHIELKKLFRQVSVKASDRKFVIYAACK